LQRRKGNPWARGREKGGILDNGWKRENGTRH